MASAGFGGTVSLWNVATKKLLGSLSRHEGGVRCLAFSPDGETIASGGFDRTVRLWDVKSHEVKAILSGHAGTIQALQFSPDGHTLVSGGDRSVALWDVPKQRERATLQAPGYVWSIAVSPNGQMIAAGLDDGSVKLWQASTVEEVRQAGL
jgi:WD40 repeat protein